MISEKLLPISIPPSESYQGLAFMMSIVLNNENIRNEFFNSFTNLQCSDKENLRDTELCFTESMWEDFRLKGIVEMDLYYVKNISRKRCADFLKERIDQDNYILIFDVDEFYLPYSIHYKKLHYIHDVYLYGYDESHFFVMAYRNKKLDLFQVDQRDIISSIYKYDDGSRDCHFCSLRPYHAVNVEINDNEIAKNLSEYINGYFAEDGTVYGMCIYDVLLKCLCRHGREDALDIRVFRMFWEHKKVFLMKYLYLEDKYKFDKEIINQINCVVEEAEKIFMLAIKYNQTNHINIITQIESKLTDIKKSEYDYISKILERMRY